MTTINVPIPDVCKYHLTETENLNLKRMIREQDVEDNTERIRQIKHSDFIAADLLKIRAMTGGRPMPPADQVAKECPFLYEHYPDIFQRAVKEELNYQIFSQFLYVLKNVEEGRCDVHQGAALIGKLLKEIYIDSAIRHGENLDSQRLQSTNSEGTAAAAAAAESKEAAPTPIAISWKEFRQGRM
jgi:predicted TPR repeat methyltransferase